MSEPLHLPRLQALALILGVAVCFVGIFDRDLWTPDEPRDAAVSLAMSRTGDLMIPRLAGEPFVEKPPLYFAVAAGSARILGPIIGNTGAIRATSALWGVGVLAMVFLLARRLAGTADAILASVLLATMTGFVVNYHWIRVDAALGFFVVAALWGFGEFYYANRLWFCLSAGLFTACAFLVKGPIGPILIATGWIGMVIGWLRRQRQQGGGVNLHPFAHLVCAAAFLLPVIAWLVAFRASAGKALWDQWFWVNQTGRLNGTAAGLGHLHRDPFYYLEVCSFYCLPWLPGIVLWFVRVGCDLRARQPLSPARMFLLAWSLLTIVLLSLSVTKREIYLTPVLPAFAIMGADVLRSEQPGWMRVVFSVWMWLAFAILAASALLPLGLLLASPAALPGTLAFLRSFGVGNSACGLGAALCLWLILQRREGPPEVLPVAVVTALLYIGLFLGAGQALDRIKSMQEGVRRFVAQVPSERRPRAAGWKFSETMLGCFEYYGDWAVPQIRDGRRLTAIIAGKDPEYDSVIVDRERGDDEIQKQPHRVLAEGESRAGKRRRSMAWVEGLGAVRP